MDQTSAARASNSTIGPRNLLGLLAASALAVTGLGVTGGSVSADPGPADPGRGEVVFDTPGTYEWQVPQRVTAVSVEALGASGGDTNSWGDAAGGNGGLSAATVVVTPGETLQVNVGGEGTQGGDGGYNGGGASVTAGCERGGSGGGASDLRRGGTDLGDRIVVAGGGGGGGTADFPGDGGDGGGDTPTAGTSEFLDDLGGGPGTPSAGGAGSDRGYPDGLDGSFGLGADNTTDGCLSSGAGGGGWYGGGSGSGFYPEASGGGGGGSGYVIPAASAVSYGNGVNDGDGSVTISWTNPPPATTAPPTTAPPKTAPASPRPRPTAPKCPDPAPPLRAFPTRPSLLLAAYLIDNCGYSARGLIAAGSPVTAMDPPASSVCPPWAPHRVRASRPSVAIAGFLVSRCGYSIKWQFNGMRLTPYVVPHGWTPGARVAA